MYKVFPAPLGGWLIYYCEKGKEPRLADGQKKPYSQRTHAHRRARNLNKMAVDKIAKENGGAIIL